MAGDIFGLHEVSHVHLFDYVTKEPIVTIEYATSNQTEIAGERSYITGGYGNARWMSFDSSKTATYQLGVPMIDLKLLGLLGGNQVVTGVIDLLQKDTVTIGTDHTATLKHTPKSGAPIFINKAVGDTNDIGDSFTVSETAPASATEVQIAADVLTFEASVTGDVNIFYTYASEATVKTSRTLTGKFPKLVTVLADGVWKDEQDGTYKLVKMQIYKASPQVAYTLAQSASGDASSLEVNFDMYSTKVNGENVYMDTSVVGDSEYTGSAE
jgi:hypothetical protein